MRRFLLNFRASGDSREFKYYRAEKGAELNKEKAEKIKAFEDQDCLFISDLFLIFVTATGEKRGSDIECYFESEEKIMSFINLLNSTGLNCFSTELGEYSILRFFMGFSEEFEDLETISLEEMNERPIKKRIFITRENSFNSDFFRKMDNLGPEKIEYHQEIGYFYGFEEENIEAYIEDEKSNWKDLLKRKIGQKKNKSATIQLEESIEKYGEDLTEREKKIFKTFNFGVLEDSENMFEKALENAMKRREKLEDSGVKTEEFIDAMT